MTIQQRHNKKSTFPIPSSLHDLERAPYNLLPYPNDFDDDDEAARADSFDALVAKLEDGNEQLGRCGLDLFWGGESVEHDDEEDVWMDEERIQALYTLVRKSTSLAPKTRARLLTALCEALQTLSSLLDSYNSDENKGNSTEHHTQTQTGFASSQVVPQSFRDAFACHLYMLFSIMFFTESEAKGGHGLDAKGNNNKRTVESDRAEASRAACADCMMVATKAMAKNRAKLWQRSVPDEAVVILPCRIAFQILESATGVVARKACSADAAMAMIACTVGSCTSNTTNVVGSDNTSTSSTANNGLLGTIVAALMDLMHSYEHMAPLCAELCEMVPEQPTNQLAIELLREIGRLNTNGLGDNSRASGIRNVAPFLHLLATKRPRIVLNNIAHLMPHLNSEVYNLRSSIATAIAVILSSEEGLKEGNNNDGLRMEREDGASHEIGDAAKTRNALLDLLAERVLDVSSFTRGAVLKAWIQIVQSRALPVDRFIPVTLMAIDRLQDKTIMARRQAMQLLTVLLENNPYMGNLDPERYRVKLQGLYDFVRSNLPDNIEEAHEAALAEAQESNDQVSIGELEQATLCAAIAEAEAYNEDELTEKQELFRNKVQALKFTQGCLEFIDVFENANTAFQGMLLSANSSDVTEALRFFVRARHFNLPCAITGMKSALALMWSTEQAIREEVRKAFVEVFIAEPGTDGKEFLPDNQIAENLLVLVGSATVSELASIEEAVVCLVQDEKIPADVFLTFWGIISKGPDEVRASAMDLISMGSSADKSIVDSKSRLKLLLDFCLGDYAEEKKDWKLVRATSCALQKAERAVVDEECAKYLVLERIIEQLCAVTRGDWCSDDRKRDTLQWFSAAEEAIKALFVISPCPEKACAEIVRGMYLTTFRNNQESQCHSLRLARFFHVLGNVALNLLCYTEELSSGVRRANAKKTLQKQVDADKNKAKKNQQNSSKDSESEDEMEAELGIAAEVEAETERQMAEITETEILGRGLIDAFAPLLVKVVGNEGGNFNSEVLMQASMLALCKFMCVSASFCEKHLPLVFSALARAPKEDTVMRANTVVALGDLAFRFPNEVEPFTPHLYACLRDGSTKVRRHTLMVLTHLILNDMVKVKGQVCEIALCLQDDDARIRDMAGLLFHSLSNRAQNPIYNLLPDIISQLSQLDNLSTESFRSILLFLLGFIKKERQNTMLTEKLTIRINKAESMTVKADLAFCISQLKHSEKSIKGLMDSFKLYKDALHDEDVKKSFMSVLTKAKKNAKPDLRTQLDEWEGKIMEFADKGKEDADADANASLAKKMKRKSKRTKKQKQKMLVESDNEGDYDGEEAEEGEEDFEFDENDKENASSRRSSRRVQQAVGAT